MKQAKAERHKNIIFVLLSYFNDGENSREVSRHF